MQLYWVTEATFLGRAPGGTAQVSLAGGLGGAQTEQKTQMKKRWRDGD